jgi:phenylalanyl-tRNA synthetase beta chain
VAAAIDLPAGVFLFELDAQAWLDDADVLPQYRPPSRFPSVYRDLAVVVSRETESEALRRAIAGAAPSLVRSVRLFDVYSGRPLPEDRVSLAFSLQLAAEDRTLTDVEADEILARTRAELSTRFGAEFRG